MPARAARISLVALRIARALSLSAAPLRITRAYLRLAAAAHIGTPRRKQRDT